MPQRTRRLARVCGIWVKLGEVLACALHGGARRTAMCLGRAGAGGWRFVLLSPYCFVSRIAEGVNWGRARDVPSRYFLKTALACAGCRRACGGRYDARRLSGVSASTLEALRTCLPGHVTRAGSVRSASIERRMASGRALVDRRLGAGHGERRAASGERRAASGERRAASMCAPTSFVIRQMLDCNARTFRTPSRSVSIGTPTLATSCCAMTSSIACGRIKMSERAAVIASERL